MTNTISIVTVNANFSGSLHMLLLQRGFVSLASFVELHLKRYTYRHDVLSEEKALDLNDNVIGSIITGLNPGILTHVVSKEDLGMGTPSLRQQPKWAQYNLGSN